MSTPKYKKESTPPPREGSRRIEEDLVRILALRVTGVAKSAAKRKERGKSVVDPVMEKDRWQAWEKAAVENGLDARIMRRLFSMLNDLSYAKAQGGPAWKSSAMNLAPERMPEAVDITGPGDSRLCRFWAAAAASSGASAVLAPVVMSDPVFELVQALASSGANLTRGEDSLESGPGNLSFGERAIFAGSDELNIYIMLSLLAPHAGRYTISGTGRARAADLSAAAAGFARLGMRVTSIEPMSKGLPVRVETPGIEKAELRLPEDFPLDAALALVAAGPGYPGGASLAWEPGWAGGRFMDEARPLLSVLGLPAEESFNGLGIPPGYHLDAEAVAPLDPVLSANALGLARTTGRRVRLAGLWPDNSTASAAKALLESAGLRLTVARDAVSAEPSGKKSGDIRADVLEDLLPLALALALALPEGARIKAPAGYDRLAAEGFVNVFGSELKIAENELTVSGKGRPGREAYLAPTAHYALSALTASPARPGARLANPGILSEIWPGIVQLYKTLFRASGASPKEDDRDDDGGTGKRRVRL